MFSNEAGMGSTPNAAAAATSYPLTPVAQGIVQMIGVFSDNYYHLYSQRDDYPAGGESRVPPSTEGTSFSNMQRWFLLTGEWGKCQLCRAYRHSVRETSSIVANYIFTPRTIYFFCGYITQRPSGYYACDAWHGYRRYAYQFLLADMAAR